MYELSEAAARDIDGILDYTVRTYGPAQAERYFFGLDEKFQRLAASPELNRERLEFKPPVRIHHHVRHLIVYLAKEAGGIFIIRVLHDRMDVEQQLEGEV